MEATGETDPDVTAAPIPTSLGRRRSWAEVAAHDGRGARVLIVDDDLVTRRMLERLLAGFGYDPHVAASAEEAEQYTESVRFHACLLDIDLPGMKGVEFLARALERDPELAVIMLTGMDDAELATECLRSGARTYLVKPINVEFLELALRDAVAVRELLVHRNLVAGSGEGQGAGASVR